ncbi:MAG: hypothetical protein ACYS9X_28420 [Planctomycetota bacterium]|jgi:hypothetical protein
MAWWKRTPVVIMLALGLLVIAGFCIPMFQYDAIILSVDPNPRIQAVLARASRIEVRVRRQRQGEDSMVFDTRAVLTGEADKRQLGAMLLANPILPRTSGWDACGGDPHLWFFSGDQVLAVISVHHGQTLRWRAEFRNDVNLTADSRKAIVRYLADMNLPEYTKMIEKAPNPSDGADPTSDSEGREE